MSLERLSPPASESCPAAGFSAAAIPGRALSQSPLRSTNIAPGSVSIESRRAASVLRHPRPLHVRFRQLEYRSGLILTSGFGCLACWSGIALDKKGGLLSFPFSDKEPFTGRIVYSGRE